jgi:hypothetical protein
MTVLRVSLRERDKVQWVVPNRIRIHKCRRADLWVPRIRVVVDWKRMTTMTTIVVVVVVDPVGNCLIIKEEVLLGLCVVVWRDPLDVGH